jgi:hypothetical protein
MNQSPMKRIAALSLTTLIAIAVLVYGVDYLVWQYKLATGHAPYGTVTVQFYYAIQEKNGKTEYDYQPPQPDTCVNSLFPHAGYTPCWYERKHPEKVIRI